MAAQDGRALQEVDPHIAQLLERQILGEDRRAMPCGCIMKIRDEVRGVRYFGFPAVICEEHLRNGCPHINAKVPDE